MCGQGTREAWVKAFPNASHSALDLLQQLLRFDPTERISAAAALKHDYLKQFHDEFVEREAPCGVKVCIPDDEKRSTNHYRERLYKEVAEFKRAEKADDDRRSAHSAGVKGERAYHTGARR